MISIAAGILRDGGLVGMPTETVYGLAASARDASAIAAVFATKERPLFDPLIAHFTGAAGPMHALEQSALVDFAGFDRKGLEVLVSLATHGWPGPLTLVLPRTASVPDLATAGLPTVAVRMPDHPVAAALIAAAGPLVAPSANRFGRISPTRAEHVVAELGDRVALVLDGGACTVGLESTIVEVSGDGSLTLMRPGGTPVAAIEAWGGRPVTPWAGRVAAPGQLPSHYAPQTRVILYSGEVPAGLPPRVGILRMSPGVGSFAAETVLSATGDLTEIARNLFAGLRELDSTGCDVILAELPGSDAGLGHAIRDRLLLAAHRG